MLSFPLDSWGPCPQSRHQWFGLTRESHAVRRTSWPQDEVLERMAWQFQETLQHLQRQLGRRSSLCQLRRCWSCSCQSSWNHQELWASWYLQRWWYWLVVSVRNLFYFFSLTTHFLLISIVTMSWYRSVHSLTSNQDATKQDFGNNQDSWDKRRQDKTDLPLWL